MYVFPQNRDKDKSEATNNEQRLPLKKRHYHISNTSSNDPEASPKSDSTSSDSVKSSGTKSSILSLSDKTNEKSQLISLGGGKGCSTPKSSICSSNSSGKSTCVSKTEVKSKSEIHRNSIDEAIEACITKYSVDESRSVIFTPKKRHRLEMERKDKSPGAHVRNIAGNKPESNSPSVLQPNKRASSRSSSTSNQALQSPASPAHGSVVSAGKRTSTRSIVPASSVATSVITSVTSASSNSQLKRSSSRSSGVLNAGGDASALVCASSSKGVLSSTPSSKRSHPRNVSETTVTPVQSTEQPQKRSSRVLTSPSAGVTPNSSSVFSPVGTQKRAVTRSMDVDSSVVSSSPPLPTSSLVSSSIASKAKPVQLLSQPSTTSLSVTPAITISSCSSSNDNVSCSTAVSNGTQNTRAASKLSGNTTASSVMLTDLCPRSPRAKVTQKPPAGVFEPSSKPETPVDVVDFPAVLNKITERLNHYKNRSLEANISSSENRKAVDAVTSVVSSTSVNSSSVSVNTTVVSSTAVANIISPKSEVTSGTCGTTTTTSNLLPIVSCAVTVSDLNESSAKPKQLGQIDLRSTRPKRINEDKNEEDRKGKKRKVIKDIRVHVMKLSPSDIILKKAMSTVKHKIRRRKAINRTGFPVKKKKKKKPILVDAGQMEASSSPPPVLEDQTKIELTVGSSPLHDTPSLTPVCKIKEEIIIKEEKAKVEKEESSSSRKSELKVVKEKIIRTSNRRLLHLRARAEASKRRKRKRNGVLHRDSSSEPICTHSPLPTKRLRKMKEEEEDDR